MNHVVGAMPMHQHYFKYKAILRKKKKVKKRIVISPVKSDDGHFADMDSASMSDTDVESDCDLHGEPNCNSGEKYRKIKIMLHVPHSFGYAAAQVSSWLFGPAKV